MMCDKLLQLDLILLLMCEMQSADYENKTAKDGKIGCHSRFQMSLAVPV